MAISSWLVMSTLRKAIRRGREDLGVSAAATLFRDAPKKLRRRIGCIAFEDAGIASVDAASASGVL
jgi:replication-associated recombination protein RarA